MIETRIAYAEFLKQNTNDWKIRLFLDFMQNISQLVL